MQGALLKHHHTWRKLSAKCQTYNNLALFLTYLYQMVLYHITDHDLQNTENLAFFDLFIFNYY